MSPEPTTAPPYVHRIVDAWLRHQPLDFQGEHIPDDLRVRLEQYDADVNKIAEERDTDFTDAHMALVGQIAMAVSAEFERSLGINLGANRDDTWLKAGDGIAAKMGIQHVGWYHEEGERAHMFVRADLYPDPPGDGRRWYPVFALTEYEQPS